MTLAFFHNLVHTSAETRFTMVVSKNKALYLELAESYPRVSVVYTKDRIAFSTWFARTLFQKNIIIIPPSFGIIPSSVKVLGFLLSRLPGSEYVGFKDKGRLNNLYKKQLTFDLEALYYNNLVAAGRVAGLELSTDRPTFLFASQPEALSSNHLVKNEYIVVHPFAANTKRSLPTERWNSLVEFINHTMPHKKVVITGGKGDTLIAQKIVGKNDAMVKCGISIRALSTLVEDSSLFIGVDTGITHLASLLNKKTILIGNLSNPSWLPTYSTNTKILVEPQHCTCRGDKTGDCTVYDKGVAYFRCLYDIPQRTIEQEITNALA